MERCNACPARHSAANTLTGPARARAGAALREPGTVTVIRQLRLYKGRLSVFLADSTGSTFAGFPGSKNAAGSVANLVEVMESMRDRGLEQRQRDAIQKLIDAAEALAAKRFSRVKDGVTYYNDFTILDFEPLIQLIDDALEATPSTPAETTTNEDAPVQFDVSQLPDFVDDLSADGAANANTANFVAYLTLRIRSLLADHRLSSVIDPSKSPTLSEWLCAHLGDDGSQSGRIAILDLSLVPSDTVHTIIAVFARVVFEALQRYRKQHPLNKTLPTVLVLEEAHIFVRRGTEEEGGSISPSRLCREAFEKIAREGRKFGLGLVLSSQRPSELSPTVLAQCNTFLLHRIVNDADQNLITRLVPDNVAGLLKELPSLPSRQAILLGWAALIPVLVEMRQLSESQRPRSEDPDFWKVWTAESRRDIAWRDVAAEWIGGAPSQDRK